MSAEKLLEKITPLEIDFARWYTDVVRQGNLIAYGAAKGSIFYKPNAYGIWANIQRLFDAAISAFGVQNVYLPLLIPQDQIEREKAHIVGFAPELALVTKVGDEELAVPLVLRPTSEVLFGELFAQEIQSYQDLPKLYNQWANIVRWEKTTNPFLRSREFLWQEGHTAHASPVEAQAFAWQMINFYADFCAQYLALPTRIGRKTEHEKFAGAEITYTIEAMMKDGRALQSGTAHYLGQNFARAFNVSFKNQANASELVYQTSWGVSTRLIGALIMSHGDNRGIVIPPRVALYQIDVLTLFGDKHPAVLVAARDVMARLQAAGIRVRLDDSPKQPGFKASRSEIEGTPLRLEIGPRDLAQGMVTLVRRDTLVKEVLPLATIVTAVQALLTAVQADLLQAAEARLEANIVHAKTFADLEAFIKARKFVVLPFAGDGADEAEIKRQTGATTRYIWPTASAEAQTCFWTKTSTKRLVVFARAY